MPPQCFLYLAYTSSVLKEGIHMHIYTAEYSLYMQWMQRMWGRGPLRHSTTQSFLLKTGEIYLTPKEGSLSVLFGISILH